MAILNTQINTRSPEYAANQAAMQRQVDELQRLLNHIHQGGGAKAQERHTSRGKLLPRERINALLDPGSPFLEVAPLAAHEVYGEDVPAAEYRDLLAKLDGMPSVLADLKVGESPAGIASGIEFVLEGLHLTKRLNKDAVGTRATYRARG